MCVLEPPSVSLVAVEVKADVPIRDAKVCDNEFSLSNLVQLDHQAVDKLACLRIDVCLNVEHREGLSDATLSEDIWELSVYLHVKVDFLTDKRGGKRRLVIRWSIGIILGHYFIENLVELYLTLSVE